MRKVIIESPYAGKDFHHGPRWLRKIIKWVSRQKNIKYARECLKNSLKRNEAPLLFHLLYTQVLDDNKPNERYLGMHAGFEWTKMADAVILYKDRGISSGMKEGRTKARKAGIEIEHRKIK